jgi:hypothetical protein
VRLPGHGGADDFSPAVLKQPMYTVNDT